MQHEAVDLRFSERVGAFLFDRILGGHHHERLIERVGRVADGHLLLLHRLEQGALHLGRRSVDLVRQHEVREDRALLGGELAALLVVDDGAGHVGWEQVRRKLNSLELRGDRLADRVDGQRLGEPRNAFEQDVPAREQPNQDPLDHHVLTHDDLVDLVKNRFDESALALNHFVDGTDVVRHEFSLGPSG